MKVYSGGEKVAALHPCRHPPAPSCTPTHASRAVPPQKLRLLYSRNKRGATKSFFFCILYRWPVLVLFPVLQLVSFSVTQAPCMVTSPAALQTASASRYNSYQDGFPNISHQLFRSYPPCGIGASVRWRVFI